MTTLEKIQARMKKLQAQAETLLARQAQAAVDQIRDLMLKHGLTTADIEAKAKAKREAKANGRTTVGRGVKASVKSTGKLPAKYLNPKTGETWSGHARPPAWIKDVKDRTKFLIDGAKTASPAKKGGASKGKSEGTLSAKYRDPKSGATWSGRGPAPKWLASAKDRSKFLIEQAAAVPKVASSKSKTASKKSASVKKAAKKPSTKTAVTAKKAAARKRTPRKVAPATATTMPTPEATSTASA
ncbi:hypothetical protein CR51_26615 [Caballeronia megalochromosomata]|nr:hypothetical protein CR51_26615 [Caballeronia megalochromosomata]